VKLADKINLGLSYLHKESDESDRKISDNSRPPKSNPISL